MLPKYLLNKPNILMLSFFNQTCFASMVLCLEKRKKTKKEEKIKKNLKHYSARLAKKQVSTSKLILFRCVLLAIRTLRKSSVTFENI